MKERLFRFKQFSVAHSMSAMKVGVDGVLLGAWASLHGKRALDIGTGCGLIALMLAQRNPDISITGIDIDAASSMEASGNFEKSPWSSRLRSEHISLTSFLEITAPETFDLIVSNPPFFNSGVESITTAREAARHQSALTVESLMISAESLLARGGTLAVIYPTESEEIVTETASLHGLRVKRICKVRDHDGAEFKRVMMEFDKNTDNHNHCAGTGYEELTMFDSEKNPTERYRTLCHDFYLKF